MWAFKTLFSFDAVSLDWSKARPGHSLEQNADKIFHFVPKEKFWVGAVCDGVSSTKFAKEAASYARDYLTKKLKTKACFFKDNELNKLISDLTNSICLKWGGLGLTTLSMLLVDFSVMKYQMITVGDTPIYKGKEDFLFNKISEDDSVVLKTGKRVLTQALGVSGVIPRLENGNIFVNDTFIIASDGVSSRFFTKDSLSSLKGLEKVVEKSQSDTKDDASILVLQCKTEFHSVLSNHLVPNKLPDTKKREEDLNSMIRSKIFISEELFNVMRKNEPNMEKLLTKLSVSSLNDRNVFLKFFGQ